MSAPSPCDIYADTPSVSLRVQRYEEILIYANKTYKK